MRSLRFRVTAITVVAILTTVAFVLFASFSIIQAQADRNSAEMMNLIDQDTGKSLEKYTEDIEQSVDMIANIAAGTLDSVTLVRNGAAGSAARIASQTPEQAARLDTYMSEYCDGIQRIAATIANHAHGVVSYYYCINPKISATEHGFYYSNMGKTGFAERKPLQVQSPDEGDWYRTAVERGRPSWIGPYNEPTLDGMWICSYVVPIYEAGTLIGVIGMDTPADVLVDQVRAIQVYDTGFASLLDEQGRVIYHPELPYGSELELSVGSDVFQQADSGNELIRYTTHGQERLMSFTTLSNGMKLAIVAPASEVNATSMQLITFVLPVTLFIMVLFAVISLLIMRVVTDPLRRLTAASQKLASGDYDVALDYKGNDEIGSLTTAFQRMRDQIKENIEDLNRRVLTDDLTGLPNQRHFFDLAETERKRLLASGEQPVMLYFNLMGMKHFNRQYGFDEGDKLICALADVLRRHFGEQNTSRFAQDHFAVVTTEDHLEERVREILRECRTMNEGKTVPVSVGVYPDSLEAVSASVACDRAKHACDRRKGSYISGLRRYNEEMLKEVDLARYAIEHIDQALSEHWIQVYFQPIVRAANGRVCDEEALSRWIDPTRGFLSPADFIPALERAGLIYKLDLYILEQVLAKMQLLKERGLTVVSQSINLSRSDFESCDIVEEIRQRVDAAGIERSMISVEITESIIGRDFGFMKMQIDRFQKLGFPVWMDDFGSGYSSLDVLQSIPFDLIKFDMSFMRKLDEGENGKVILTQMMQMANALGVDTICEGVETEAQRQFLLEIGCSKLQGYLFCKPVSLDQLLERYEKGEQIGFENPAESEYYETIGRLNLYDLSVVTNEDDSSIQNIFDTLPVAVIEVKGSGVHLVRSNRSFREFSARFFGTDVPESITDFEAKFLELESPLTNALRECSETGTRAIFDDKMPDGSIAHSIVRRVGTNPVTGATAVVLAGLSIADPDEGTTYASIARALARDYYNIYYVDLDTGQFIEYRSPIGGENLVKERRGSRFFEETVEVTRYRMYEGDREAFLATFTRDNVVRALDERGVFTATYRLVDTGEPMRVNMKITRLEPGSNRVIIGVSID